MTKALGPLNRLDDKRRPNSQSMKSWARYLRRVVRDPVNIRNPERYLNSHAKLAWMRK